MLVSLPANPVGSIGTPELYAEIVAFCKKYNILLVHDNAYSDIIFDGAHGGSVFNTPGAEEVAVEFFSLSKSFNVTGARISFLVGRPDVVAACKKLRTQIDFGMFYPIQRAAIAALTGPLDSVRAQCGVYQARRDALCGGLRGIGWPVPDSHGSMFVWAPLPAGWRHSMAFCLRLIDAAGVICTPGASFGPSAKATSVLPSPCPKRPSEKPSPPSPPAAFWRKGSVTPPANGGPRPPGNYRPLQGPIPYRPGNFAAAQGPAADRESATLRYNKPL